MNWMFIVLPAIVFVIIMAIVIIQDEGHILSGMVSAGIISLCLAAALITIAHTDDDYKCISTEYRKVEVEIVNKYHRVPITISTGKTTMSMPAVYNITVEYHGTEYTVSGRDTYYEYKDKVGEKTKGILEIRVYDDLSEKYDIISLE